MIEKDESALRQLGFGCLAGQMEVYSPCTWDIMLEAMRR